MMFFTKSASARRKCRNASSRVREFASLPIIRHLKADHRMERCHLKGETGDRLHAVLCAAAGSRHSTQGWRRPHADRLQALRQPENKSDPTP
ncbi:hypothetical protein F9K07_15870 [Hydrogenophaga sp. BPS33]|nr:hypothetical protein F9K07_15870 [Hydrogenophaga sp. BPS33]